MVSRSPTIWEEGAIRDACKCNCMWEQASHTSPHLSKESRQNDGGLGRHGGRCLHDDDGD